MHTWHGQVRDYELDSQKVVNNANYLHYFEHARHLMLAQAGINFIDWQKNDFDLVLLETTIKYKRSLRAYDEFYITTQLKPFSKIKIYFEQQLFLKTTDTLAADLHCIGACIDRKRNKACMPGKIAEIIYV